MWTSTTRRQYSRGELRYESDLSDKEWALIRDWMPGPCELGRPLSWSWREIVNAIFYALRAGCPWRLLPDSFPPWQTVYRWFAGFRDSGLFERINHALVMADRERVGREASPSAAIIDSQSVKTTESGGPRGYDAGKKIKGRKRHALVDSSRKSLPTLVTPVSASPPPRRSPSRSSEPSPARKASPFSPGAGLSSASLPGSTATGAWQRTSKPPSLQPVPSSMPHPS
jgi:transposase